MTHNTTRTVSGCATSLGNTFAVRSLSDDGETCCGICWTLPPLSGTRSSTASETFLKRETETAVSPMPRAVRFEWDHYHRVESPHSQDSHEEQHTNRSSSSGTIATGELA